MRRRVGGRAYADDGVYAVGDMSPFEGRQAIAGVTSDPHRLALVATGCAHVSTLPHAVIDGDRAAATCHTMLVWKAAGDGFFVGRLSASRLDVSRGADGVWRIDRRQNVLRTGDGRGPALPARLHEPPAA